jgi:hypothetical protein
MNTRRTWNSQAGIRTRVLPHHPSRRSEGKTPKSSSATGAVRIHPIHCEVNQFLNGHQEGLGVTDPARLDQLRLLLEGIVNTIRILVGVIDVMISVMSQ